MSQGTLEHNWIRAKIKSNSCFRFKCWFQFRFVCKKSSSRYMPSSPWQVILGGKSLTGQFNIENCWGMNECNYYILTAFAGKKHTVMSEIEISLLFIWKNMLNVVSAEIYTAGKSDGSDKSQLWAKVTKRISRFQCYQSLFRGLMVYVPLIPKLIVLTGWWLSEAEQSVIIEHIVTSRLSQSQSRRRPLPAGPQGVAPLLPWLQQDPWLDLFQ